MAEAVPDAHPQQQAQQGQAAQSSPIFAEEAGQIEPPHTRGRSVIPRAPGTSPLGAEQADGDSNTGDAGGTGPGLDAQKASGAAGIITCVCMYWRIVKHSRAKCTGFRRTTHAERSHGLAARAPCESCLHPILAKTMRTSAAQQW